MAIVTFSADEFKLRYPEFASVSSELLALYFSDAGLYCNNSDGSFVKDVVRRKAMLYSLVAHIAALADPNRHGQMVGRVNSAREGSVSVTTEMAPATQSNAWFMQTPYGATFWQLAAPYRSAIFVPPTCAIEVFIPE